MRSALASFLALTLLAAAHAQTNEIDGVRAYDDPETGARVFDSYDKAKVEQRPAPTLRGSSALNFWAEVRLEDGSAPQVTLVGYIARVRHGPDTPPEHRGKFGPQDPDWPALVGRPYRQADVRVRGTLVLCEDLPTPDHTCQQIDDYEIVLEPERVKQLISERARDYIRISLARDRSETWRCSQSELIDVLTAAGVIDQFR